MHAIITEIYHEASYIIEREEPSESIKCGLWEKWKGIKLIAKAFSRISPFGLALLICMSIQLVN